MRLKYALRSLAAAPSFTIGSILCLSVGLALTIAAFSLVNAVLFRSMPGIHDQSSLRHVWLGAAGQYGPEIVPPTLLEYDAYRDSLADIAAVTAAIQVPVAVQVEGTAVVTRAVFAPANYFQVLGTVPVLGGLPAADGFDAVIGERFWRAHLAGRPDVIGRTVAIGEQSFRIAGVAPAAFVGASTGKFDDDPTTSRELGIRLALGARPRDVFRLVVGESTLVAVAGAVVGGIAAALIANAMRSMFVGVGPADPVSFAAASAVLIAATLVASAGPALRAARTDPSKVLRAE